MSKNVFLSILELYELPVFLDREEFYDKVVSYLYMQFRFKQIEGVNKSELGFDLSLFDDGAIACVLADKKTYKLSKKNILDLNDIKKIIICVDRSEMKNFISFKLGKQVVGKFEKLKELKLFISSIEAFFERQEKSFKNVRNYLKKKETIVAKEPNVAKIVAEKEEVKTGFLQATAKNMPEKIKLTQSLEKAESVLIKEMLRRTKGKKVEAAQRLGITERMIGYKIKKFNL